MLTTVKISKMNDDVKSKSLLCTDCLAPIHGGEAVFCETCRVVLCGDCFRRGHNHFLKRCDRCFKLYPALSVETCEDCGYALCHYCVYDDDFARCEICGLQICDICTVANADYDVCETCYDEQQQVCRCDGTMGCGYCNSTPDGFAKWADPGLFARRGR